MTNIKSTTRFPTSYRWSVYVTPKSPKVGSKSDFFRFLSKSQRLIVSGAVNLVRLWVSKHLMVGGNVDHIHRRDLYSAATPSRRNCLITIWCGSVSGIRESYLLQRPYFDGFIYIRYAAPPYSAVISATYLLPFDTVWLGSVCWPRCATPGNEAERRIYRERSKTQVLFQPVCGPKFMKFWNDVADPSYFSTPLPDCLCHFSFRRQSPLSLEVVEKPNKC